MGGPGSGRRKGGGKGFSTSGKNPSLGRAGAFKSMFQKGPSTKQMRTEKKALQIKKATNRKNASVQLSKPSTKGVQKMYYKNVRSANKAH
jgi:hypothetical protein